MSACGGRLQTLTAIAALLVSSALGLGLTQAAADAVTLVADPALSPADAQARASAPIELGTLGGAVHAVLWDHQANPGR